MCDECPDTHSEGRVSWGQESIDKGNVDVMHTAAAWINPVKCDNCKNRLGEASEQYCSDCHAVLCSKCFDGQLKSHGCCDVSTADEFHKQLAFDIERVAEAIVTCRDILRQLEESKKGFSSIVGGIEKEIRERVELLRRTIDSEEQRLLHDLGERKRHRIKQIQLVIGRVEQHVSFADSFIDYAKRPENTKEVGSIARQSCALRERVDELLNVEHIGREVNDLGSMAIKFEASNLPVNGNDSLVGQIHWQHTDGRLTWFDLKCLLYYIKVPVTIKFIKRHCRKRIWDAEFLYTCIILIPEFFWNPQAVSNDELAKFMLLYCSV